MNGRLYPAAPKLRLAVVSLTGLRRLFRPDYNSRGPSIVQIEPHHGRVIGRSSHESISSGAVKTGHSDC